MRHLRITLQAHKKAPPQAPIDVTWRELVDELTSHGKTQTGKDGRGIIGADFSPSGTTLKGEPTYRRKIDLINEVHLVGIDLDDVPEDWFDRVTDAMPVAAFVFTTHSHGRPGKGIRARVLYPLSRPITVEEHRELYLWMQAQALGKGIKIDGSCKDPARLHYTPRVRAPDGAAPFIKETQGEWLNPDALLDGSTVADLVEDRRKAREKKAKTEEKFSFSPSEVPTLDALGADAKGYARQAAHLKCQRAVERLSRAGLGERRSGLHKTAVIIGGWEGNRCLTRSEADQYVEHAVRVVAALLNNPTEAADLRRQAENGRLWGGAHPWPVPRAPKDDPGIVRLPILSDGTEMRSLDDARDETYRLVMGGAEKGRRLCVASDPGTGKTQAAMRLIMESYLAGKSVRYAAATNGALRERRRDLIRLVDSEYPEMGFFAPSSNYLWTQPKRTPSSCPRIARVELGRKIRGNAGAQAACRSCDLHPKQNEGRSSCSFLRDVKKEHRAEGSIVFTTHTLEMLAEQDPVDVLLIDEFPAPVHSTHHVTLAHLRAWRDHGDITVTDERWSALLALFARVEETGEAVSSGELAEALPVGAFSVAVIDGDESRLKNTWGTNRLQDLLDAVSPDSDPDARKRTITGLGETGTEAALDAVRKASGIGWLGAKIQPQKDEDARRALPPALVLTVAERLKTEEAGAVVYLDGTASENVAKSILGPDAEYHRVPVAFPKDFTVGKVKWSASKSLIPGENAFDKQGEKRKASEQTYTRLRALKSAYESNDTLWVMHKTWCQSENVQEILEEAIKAGRVTYYGHPNAVGSNQYQDCTRAVLLDRFLPKSAKEALAEVLAHSLANQDGRAAETNWSAEAAYLTEGRDIIQAMHRVRCVIEPREIILCTNRELPDDWNPWRVPDVDIDDLVLRELGVYPPGSKGIQQLLRETVSRVGFAVATRTPALSSNATDALNTLGDLSHYVRVMQTGHGREFPALVSEAGLTIGYLETSAPGKPLVIVYDSQRPPRVQQLVAALGHGGRFDWVRWLGETVHMTDERAELLNRLGKITWSRVDVTAESLAKAMGFSVATFWRKLRSAGLTMEALRVLRNEHLREKEKIVEIEGEWRIVKAEAMRLWQWKDLFCPYRVLGPQQNIHGNAIPPTWWAA